MSSEVQSERPILQLQLPPCTCPPRSASHAPYEPAHAPFKRQCQTTRKKVLIQCENHVPKSRCSGCGSHRSGSPIHPMWGLLPHINILTPDSPVVPYILNPWLLDQRDQQLLQLQAEVQTLQGEGESLRAEVESVTTQAREAERQAAEAARDRLTEVGEREARVVVLIGQVGELEEERDAALQEGEDLQGRLRRAEEERDAALQDGEVLKEQLRQAEEERDAALQDGEELQGQLRRAEEKRDAALQNEGRLQDVREQLQRAEEELEAAREEAARDLRGLRECLAAALADRDRAEQAAAEAAQELRRLRSQANSAEQEREQFRQEAEQERVQMRQESEQERARARHELEQERVRVQREAEQERVRAQREAEQERVRAQREAEQERVQARREAEQSVAEVQRALAEERRVAGVTQRRVRELTAELQGWLLRRGEEAASPARNRPSEGVVERREERAVRVEDRSAAEGARGRAARPGDAVDELRRVLLQLQDVTVGVRAQREAAVRERDAAVQTLTREADAFSVSLLEWEEVLTVLRGQLTLEREAARTTACQAAELGALVAALTAEADAGRHARADLDAALQAVRIQLANEQEARAQAASQVSELRRLVHGAAQGGTVGAEMLGRGTLQVALQQVEELTRRLRGERERAAQLQRQVEELNRRLSMAATDPEARSTLPHHTLTGQLQRRADQFAATLAAAEHEAEREVAVLRRRVEELTGQLEREQAQSVQKQRQVAALEQQLAQQLAQQLESRRLAEKLLDEAQAQGLLLQMRSPVNPTDGFGFGASPGRKEELGGHAGGRTASQSPPGDETPRYAPGPSPSPDLQLARPPADREGPSASAQAHAFVQPAFVDADLPIPSSDRRPLGGAQRAQSAPRSRNISTTASGAVPGTAPRAVQRRAPSAGRGRSLAAAPHAPLGAQAAMGPQAKVQKPSGDPSTRKKTASSLNHTPLLDASTLKPWRPCGAEGPWPGHSWLLELRNLLLAGGASGIGQGSRGTELSAAPP